MSLGLVATALSTCPVEPDFEAPAELGVAVLDVEGNPLPGVEVRAEGSSAETDEDGDAFLPGLVPGDVGVVLRADGYVPIVRYLTLAPRDQVRMRLVMRPVNDAFPVDPSMSQIVETGLSEVIFEPGDIVAIADDEEPELAYVDVEEFSSEDVALGAFPGPLLGRDQEGALVGLYPVSALAITAQDAGGRPLRIAPTSAIEVTQLFAADASNADCSCLKLWYLDPRSGLWIEAPEVPIKLVSTAAQLWVSLTLPQLGTYALAESVELGCVSVSVNACASLGDVGAQVELNGPDGVVSRALNSALPMLKVGNLNAGEVDLSLLVGQQRIDSAEVEVNPGDSCAEVTLEGPDCGGLAVVLDAGPICPAEGQTVRVYASDGRLLDDVETYGALGLFPELGTDARSVEVISAEGAVLASQNITIDGSDLNIVRFDLGAGRAEPPDGGCAVDPCWGASCQTCLQVEVRDQDGALDQGATVATCGSEDSAVTDAEGHACFDIEDGDRTYETAYLNDASASFTSAPLVAGASCDAPESCEQRAIWGDSPPDGWLVQPLSAGTYGWREPGRDGLGDTDDLDDGGWLDLALDAGPSGPSVPPDLHCDGPVTATTLLDQNPLGILYPGATSVRCSTPDGAEVELVIVWADGPLGPGSHAISAVVESLSFSFYDADTDSTRSLTLGDGQVTVLEAGVDRLLLTLDLVLSESDHMVHVAGSLNAALVYSTSLARDADALTMSLLYGAVATTHVPSTGDRLVSDLSGSSILLGGDWDTEGTKFTALPKDVASFVVGSRHQKSLPPITPVLMARATGTKIYKNGSTYSNALVPSRLLWLDRSLAARLYDASGADPATMDVGGTIYGIPAQWSDSAGRLSRLSGFGAVTLSAADGARIKAVPLNDALQACSAAVATRYVFANVPPTDDDQPYTLTLRDRSGAVVSEYTQRIVVRAGYASVIAPDVR